MEDRASKRALEAYPIEMCGYVTECKIGAKPEPQDWNEERRKCFQEGYHQAEKDNELSWKDIEAIDQIFTDVFKDGFDVITNKYYQEVLKRFKNFKERKEK